MRNVTILFLLLICVKGSIAQFHVNCDPRIQSVQNMQYFSPKGNELFVGDCIPNCHKGTFYLYWLLDSGHHSSLNGLGGHQWVLSTTEDLKQWTNYPIVIGIDEDWEKSICTGSVENDGEKFYAFYATRLVDSAGKINEQLSYATSNDAIHFTKQKPNPFYTSAPGYNKRNFRNSKVIIDSSGVFHLLVSSSIDKGNSIDCNQGCLVHLTSKELKTWKVNEPIPKTGSKLSLEFIRDQNTRKISENQYIIDAPGAIGSIHSGNIPVNCRITFDINPLGTNEDVGLYLRSTEKASAGYNLSFSANNKSISLSDTRIEAVSGLDKPFSVDIIMKDDIIDICINEQRCVLNRLIESKGESDWFYVKHGKAIIKNIKIYPILSNI